MLVNRAEEDTSLACTLLSPEHCCHVTLVRAQEGTWVIRDLPHGADGELDESLSTVVSKPYPDVCSSGHHPPLQINKLGGKGPVQVPVANTCSAPGLCQISCYS